MMEEENFKLKQMLSDSCDLISRYKTENARMREDLSVIKKLQTLFESSLNFCKCECDSCEKCSQYKLNIRLLLLRLT